MAKVLVPPPVAKSDEILAESGGMFYSRETPEHDVYVERVITSKRVIRCLSWK